MIDLRSDTVTRPTEGMLRAMLGAETGDDVYAEDPTVNRLQAVLAERFGQEAALFCPSGTMANQNAINVHTAPGDEVICHRLSHVYNYEGGGIARNSGASIRLVDAPGGAMPPEVIRAECGGSGTRHPASEAACRATVRAHSHSRPLSSTVMTFDKCLACRFRFHKLGPTSAWLSVKGGERAG